MNGFLRLKRAGVLWYTSTMPLVTLDTLPVRDLFPGLRARLIHTDRVTHSWVEIDEGAIFPEHNHPHEQIVSVIDGTLEITVAGETHTLRPGLVFVIPPNAPHSGRALTACRVLDTFSPVREDYK
jgi:quercetin dioxygenase-like cupin family protein